MIEWIQSWSYLHWVAFMVGTAIHYIFIKDRFMLCIQKYIFNTKDYFEFQEISLLPLIQVGAFKNEDGDPVAIYRHIVIPSFRCGERSDWASRRNILGWWVPFHVTVWEIRAGKPFKTKFIGERLWEEDPHDVWLRENSNLYLAEEDIEMAAELGVRAVPRVIPRENIKY